MSISVKELDKQMEELLKRKQELLEKEKINKNSENELPKKKSWKTTKTR